MKVSEALCYIVSHQPQLTGFDLVAVAFVLRLKLKVFVGWTQEHLTAPGQLVGRTVDLWRYASPDLDPIFVIGTGEESLKVVASTECWRPIAELGWHVLQQTDRDL